MSIANALNNAVSGLTAAARGTEVVSSNLANALTPGYGRRELELSPRVNAGNGGGVQIASVQRIVSNAVLADFRQSSAALGQSSAHHAFFAKLEASIGLPGETGSLTTLMSDLTSALTSAASRPDSEIRLQGVVDAAGDVGHKLRTISDSIQDSRSSADRQIAAQVTGLNSDLSEVARLNQKIIAERANGRDDSSLNDARQAVIDRIAQIVPIRELPRENGRVAIFTAGGLALLDSNKPLSLGFQPTGKLTPEIDESSALLGRLSIDGEIASTTQLNQLSGGSLIEQFRIRDEYGTAAQARVDAIARELHDRFADPTVDPSIIAGGSGLFTDPGTSLDPSKEQGLAARLRLNANIDPRQGGELWRVRDGVNALAPGEVGNSTIITGLASALDEARPYASGQAAISSGNLHGLAAAVITETGTSRLRSEARKTHDASLHDSLQGALFADAVDSDREMEMLLQLEKAYAANAKVIQAVNEMLDNILRI